MSTRKQTINKLVSSIQKEIQTASLFVNTISEITGIHPTDIKCLEYLKDVKFTTAGELAKITSLTTGATTAVIDRLENAGFVRRQTDTDDRRKIFIKLIVSPNRLKLVRNLFSNQIPKLLSGYKIEEIKLILDWNIKIVTMFNGEIEKIQIIKNKKTN